MLESNLFGVRRGAFTGAVESRAGLFAQADGGTLFLDEVGTMSSFFQTKLLRALQEGEILPVGETKTVKVDVRVVAATNVDLEAALRQGTFREDLYYRLNVIEIRVPPLRERKSDIPLLVDCFVRRYGLEYGRPSRTVGPCALELLQAYPWPGNVRELENVMQRAVVTAKSEVISSADIEFRQSPTPCSSPPPAELAGLEYEEAKQRVIGAFQRQYASQILTRSEGNITRASQRAGLTRAAFRRILRKHDITYSTSVMDKD